MRSHRLARTKGTNLVGVVVAHCEHKIELRRAGSRELVPRLRIEMGDVVVRLAQQVERERVDPACGMAAGAIAAKLAGSQAIQDALGHDRACRIAGAEEEDVQRFHSVGLQRLLLLLLWLAALDERGLDQWSTEVRLAAAAILDQEREQLPRPFEIDGIDHRAAVLA